MEGSVGGGAWGNVQDLGVCGVIKQSGSVLRTRAKLFFALASTLTLPLCFIILAHNLAIDPLLSRIQHNQDLVDSDRSLRSRITADRIRLGVLLAVYVILVLIFALLSTAATVYSVACIYTKRPLTYRKVLSVLPKTKDKVFEFDRYLEDWKCFYEKVKYAGMFYLERRILERDIGKT